MQFRFLLILSLFIAPELVLQGQDTLYMATGRMKTNIYVTGTDSLRISFIPSRKDHVNAQGRIKSKYRDRQHVFEIRYEDGSRELIYEQDSVEGNVVSPDQMRSYVNGCHDAFEFSHDRIVGPVCYLVTLGSIFVIKVPVLVVAVPCVYSAVMAIFTPEFPYDNVDPQKIDKYYILGFQDTKKIKKVKSSMFFGVAALITGFVMAVFMD